MTVKEMIKLLIDKSDNLDDEVVFWHGNTGYEFFESDVRGCCDGSVEIELKVRRDV